MIRRTNRRMTLCVCLIGLNLAFIWGNSLLPGELSAAFSQWVKDLLSAFLPLSPANPQQGHGLLRKIAHFSEFAVLGAMLCWLFAMLMNTRKRQICMASLSGWIAACVDESIQRFIPGRNGCLPDVGIDTCGVLAGITLFFMGYLIYQSKNHFLEETK